MLTPCHNYQLRDSRSNISITLGIKLSHLASMGSWNSINRGLWFGTVRIRGGILNYMGLLYQKGF